MTIKASHIVCAVAAVLFIYYVFVACMLRYSLDRLVFPHTKWEQTTEIERYSVTDLDGNEIIVRHYGNGKNGCVIFFPGQHGGIRRYERPLFDRLTDSGVAVFAISYPGQDGAKGNGDFSNVQALVQKALAKINYSYPIKDSVFIGRSLGSMLAVLSAGQYPPRGLVLEGSAPALSDAVYSYMRNKWYLRPAVLLPVQQIIKKDYVLTEAMGKLTSTKIVIFQGTNDSLMAPDNIKEIAEQRPEVRFIAVKGGTHRDTYIKALPLYIETIFNMLNRQAANKSTSRNHTDGEPVETGETIRMVNVGGEERLLYSGYLLRKKRE